MTPNIIVEQVYKKVKQTTSKEVFGIIDINVACKEKVGSFDMILQYIDIHSLSGQVHKLKVHDFELAWEWEDSDFFYGVLKLNISNVIEAETEWLIAANYLINELNVVIDTLQANTYTGRNINMTVNDFSIQWYDVYDE